MTEADMTNGTLGAVESLTATPRFFLLAPVDAQNKATDGDDFGLSAYGPHPIPELSYRAWDLGDYSLRRLMFHEFWTRSTPSREAVRAIIPDFVRWTF